MNSMRTATLVLLACMPLLGACDRTPAPSSTPAAGTDAPATALGKLVDEATQEARAKLANEPISLSDNNKSLPKAEIAPNGDLLIEGKAVPVNDVQRALLLDHRKNVVAIAEAGMAVGVRGADLGMKAAGEALKGIFNGNADEIEQRIEAEAEKIKADAVVICDRLPAMLDSQEKLAAALPEFKPYATMTREDIDECRNETAGTSATPPTPPAPPAPPAPPEG
ncbi:YggN family protein [Aerolutibacter ruishenii]|uniref:DUF2884 family protein n=1 Tax=Aerolutibacter ruishenii TaxID=686800 RepID=A0A562LYH1_9GAMM|nr:YggN family protein [Lysobacter ruishenii]TWI12660.1 hypothetical protein IP93_01005 [Lysobacter ruishenii]